MSGFKVLCFDGSEPRPCEICGEMTTVVINGYGYCHRHLEEGVKVVVRLEVLRVGAPEGVTEQATEWLLNEVRHEIAGRS